MRSIASAVGAASTRELVEAAGSIAAELAGREAPDPGPAAVQLAEALGQAVDVLEAALAGLVRRVDDTGAFGELGFSSTGAWLRSRLGMRDGRAGERVRLARQLPRLAEVAKRLAGGSLSAGHACAIADAVARLDDVDAELGERLLLDLVEQGHTAAQVAKDGAQITDLINTHRGKEKEPGDSKRGFSRSWVTKSKSLDGGLWLKGWLTPEHAAAFEEIIGPLAKPKARGDDRDLAQRTADALMSVITEGNKGAGVTVIIDLAAFTQATGDTGPFDHTPRHQPTGTGPDHSGGDHPDHPDHPGPVPGTASEGGPGAKTGPDSGAGGGLGSGPHRMASDHAAEGRSTGEPSENREARTEGPGPEPTGTSSNPVPAHPPRPETTAERPGGSRPADTAAAPRDATPGHGADPPDPQRSTGHRPKPRHRETTHHDDHLAQDGQGAEPNPGYGSGGGDGGNDRSVVADMPARGPGPVGHHARRRHHHERGQVAARLLNGTPISPERARQIALNAGINVLILGRSGLPLYLGRTVRFATPAQRKTLLALYDTCCVQGCQIPAHLAEIHHLHGGWKLGTPTDINKLVPACGWHNRWIETHPDQVKQTHDAQGRATLRLLAPWERQTIEAA